MDNRVCKALFEGGPRDGVIRKEMPKKPRKVTKAVHLMSVDCPILAETFAAREVFPDVGCILAEMIGSVRPWSLATPEDSDYSHYLMDRTVLFEKLPVSHTAYLLLRKIFSTKAELRPSLAAIRTEVLAMDTFFLTDSEAGNCGWGDRMEKQKLRKLRARGVRVVAPPSRRSSDTSSSGSYRFETCSLGSSSGSRYSCGSSSSAFGSSSGDSIELPATPPAPVAEAVRTMDKASGLVLVSRVAAAHWQTC
ncbi:hypothetical protein EDB85DRAFT_1887259 [Lactarius pseudohatsudake]|nr:hypothetical protein EDB85DRAFT_1887259 [Lactarius pseudohatsudake]